MILIVISLVLAVLLIGWVAADAARRRRNWLGWALLVAFTGLLGVIAWLVVRRRFQVVDQMGAPRVLAMGLIGVPLVFISFAVSTFVITFLAQAARVEGTAMAPTLEGQDRLIVNKLVYHFTNRGAARS